MNSAELSGDVLVQNIVVLSRVRPRGLVVDMLKKGRERHGLLYIRSGEILFCHADGKSVGATGGQLLYLPKNAKYKMQCLSGSTAFVVINFNLAEGSLPVFAANEITLLADRDRLNTVDGIMTKLEACGAAQNLSGRFRRMELLYRLMAFIHDNNPGIEDDRYPQIAKGVQLLKQTYLENLPIGTFAKHAGVSVSSFRQLFFKQHGMSPLQYRNRLRIRRARQLLEYDSCTVAEVAYASGFENIGYFCRYYKKITGETPNETKERSL